MNEKHENWLSERVLVFVIATFAIDMLVYNCARWIASDRFHYDLTTGVDAAIPLIPCMMVFYLGCYLTCALNFALCFKYDNRKGWQFFNAMCLGFIVCFAVFVLFPTSMERPQISGSDIFDRILALQYRIDPPDNLLPSIHCFVSWICWTGLRDKTEIPQWYQRISLLMAIAVCTSTLMVKQHVIADVISGIILAETSYFISAGVIQYKASKGKHFRHK
ncbi:MAG: phosphatase PAP2 family protein [Mogibacterium sp.]|nr:phosphatase PAP2 family protein [Mogibacterium sp.]